jgi:hypothetical protein
LVLTGNSIENEGTEAVQDAKVLADILDNRAWFNCSVPFPHVTANRVFKSEYFATLKDDYASLLARGLSETPVKNRLSRNIGGYDAYALALPPQYDGPLSIFMSRPWHDMLAGLFEADCTGHINCGIHHHPVGSKNGWVHNDLNPCFFVDYHSPNGINVVRHDLCSYTRGRVFRAGVRPRRLVRRVAMLFYLCNGPWFRGDGGVTGLYGSKDDAVDRPAASVPPIDNSILVFECTPYSFHSFISNPFKPRNCVIMWLHSEVSTIIARWGEGKIVEWHTVRQ